MPRDELRNGHGHGKGHRTDMDTEIDMALRFRCRISYNFRKFNPASDKMSDYSLCSSISEVPISGSVR